MNKIIYLDAAASALKPQSVILGETDFLTHHYSNAGRGICARAAETDDMLSHARLAIADFIGATSQQIIFTSGATDGLNRIANMILSRKAHLRVAVSDLDHHSARLPWVAAANRGECELVIMPLNANLDIDIEKMPLADVYVITAMSNVIGVPQDVSAIVRAARAKNPDVITIVDVAQYVAHLPIDVRAWDCDALCFSGHKIGADTGVGVMYLKNPESYHTDKFGGGMVDGIASATGFNVLPAPMGFEAGTLPLTQIAGMPFAIDNLRENPVNHAYTEYLFDALSEINRVKIISPRSASLVSFVVDGMHPLDFGAMLGAHGVCARVGNMCASWIHAHLGINGSIRLSHGWWNTMDEMRDTINIIKEILK